ncbi:hypothetical protein [Candidatus Thiodiazotropha sp. CDECU1]|uniref:hypothetical protein n=1 Tax=Candidatus Thiodiazotropha sp. CDECU1 TaxID=3065865 RepID=UPI0029307C08|nr:hypothetical protein [Candidatus Thiodiazotropha sp. CDECU1]
MAFRTTLFTTKLILLLSIFLLAACGGGGGGGGSSNPTTATGVFKDNNVSGITYTSGAQSGTTGSDGSFIYEVGQQVSFNLGNVTLGSATGRSVLTPVDLVAGGSSSSTEVLNLVRFLLMLDDDGDSSNGINISSAVQTVAENWSAVDFTTANLQSELSSIISDTASADGTSHTLPNATTARSHLESTLRCVRAGAYSGTFGGDDSGPFGVLVDASNGLLSGFAYSAFDGLLVLTGSTSVSYDQSATFISGDVSSGATFSGQFNSPNTLAGNWNLSATAESGTFSGSRIGGAANATYRFTGSFSSNVSSPVTSNGLFTFDVDSNDNVTGIAHTVYASDGTQNETVSFTGSLTGTSLLAQIMDGNVVDATITGTLNKASGIVSGSWSDVDGNTGTYSGRGCKLN